jgi:hypothetical protein
MNLTPVACLLSSLSLVGLLVLSCSTTRDFGDGAGSGGEGNAAASGGMSTVDGGAGADGTMPAAGADAAGGSNGQGLPECTAEQKLCDGMCVDINDPAYGCDPTLCTTTGCPDAAGATLRCDAGQCLLGSCEAGTKECDGRCVSLTDPTYGCGAATCDASTCPSQSTGATLVCEGSACVVGTCPDGYKSCDNKCVAISDPTYGCGATSCDASSCPPAGTGTLVCQDSTCVVGTCGAGTKKCGSNCVTTDANNGCADAARCTACANNEACSGTPSTCQCVPTPMAAACANKNCGSVSNGCNGTYTCGTCSSPSAPICVSNNCKQCSTVTDCPSGTFNCTNNTCTCRVANSANVIKDGGFDSASVLSKWTSDTAVWTSGDADGCPASGSVSVSGSISRCIQVPFTGPGTTYSLGLRYKTAANDGGCLGLFYADSNCMQGLGPDFINLGISESSIWSSDVATASVPEGTSSIFVQCQTSLTIDQIYLRAGSPGNGF